MKIKRSLEWRSWSNWQNDWTLLRSVAFDVGKDVLVERARSPHQKDVTSRITISTFFDRFISSPLKGTCRMSGRGRKMNLVPYECVLFHTCFCLLLYQIHRYNCWRLKGCALLPLETRTGERNEQQVHPELLILPERRMNYKETFSGRQIQETAGTACDSWEANPRCFFFFFFFCQIATHLSTLEAFSAVPDPVIPRGKKASLLRDCIVHLRNIPMEIVSQDLGKTMICAMFFFERTHGTKAPLI